ncbi:hypothetical protein AB1Y20_006091 [Prymnesium parvum]|uniref:Uncharacterized protein n=1 Tax=Prymnesium parvum TaxID=97485 RepID=A0AB34J3L8_PRYPA
MRCPATPLPPPRATATLERAQMQLHRSFAASDAALSSAPSTLLTALEACRLANSPRTPPPVLPSNLSRSPAAVQQRQLDFARALSAGCAASSLPAHCSLGDLAPCAYQEGVPLHLRQPLLRHAAFAADGEPSHLAAALRTLRARNHTLLVVGESTAEEVVRHGGCELARHGAAAWNASLQLEHPHGQISPSGGGMDSRLRALNASLERLLSAGGGMVLLSVGVHFNLPDRRQYAAYLRQVLPALDRFARRCERCRALVRTPSPQHFAPRGAVGTVTFRNATPFGAAYPCEAWSTTAHADADELPECWRADDITHMIGELRLRHVLVVDSGRTMQPFWRSHVGSVVKRKRAGHTGIADCTHNCPTPFLLEPLWWAVRLVATL